MNEAPRAVHHVGVRVSDMARSIAFYTDVFGFRLVQRFALGDEDLTFMEAGAARLELIASPGATERTTDPGAVDHFRTRSSGPRRMGAPSAAAERTTAR